MIFHVKSQNDMKYSLAGLFFVVAIACSDKQRYFDPPVTDFYHSCINVDSTAFAAIQKDSFLTREFGTVFVDTASISGKQSIELYLLGQETFLHFNLDKGFWENRKGGGAVVFQSRYPDKFDSIIMSWQQHYPDSLYRKMVKNEDVEVGEVAIYQKRDSSLPAKPSFFPVILSFTRETVRKWGFSDSAIDAGISPRASMLSWDTRLAGKLFKRISALHVQVTAKELAYLETAMETAGYRKEGESFVHPDNLTLHYRLTEGEAIPRYTRIDIELSRSVESRTVDMGSAYELRLSGTNAELVAK